MSGRSLVQCPYGTRKIFSEFFSPHISFYVLKLTSQTKKKMSEVLGEMIQNTQNYCQHLEQNVAKKKNKSSSGTDEFRNL